MILFLIALLAIGLAFDPGLPPINGGCPDDFKLTKNLKASSFD
tara:strand:- start:9591 stop:9719 length:129 start_codon:yes stop_codon:yes gene_type:complete